MAAAQLISWFVMIDTEWCVSTALTGTWIFEYDESTSSHKAKGT